jgi:hypothetical protein
MVGMRHLQGSFAEKTKTGLPSANLPRAKAPQLPLFPFKAPFIKEAIFHEVCRALCLCMISTPESTCTAFWLIRHVTNVVMIQHWAVGARSCTAVAVHQPSG